MTVVNKPDMNYGMWAENGNIEIPSSEKVEEGWVIEKPLNEQMNWLQNRSDKMLQYLNQRGISEWDIRTDYPINAFVAHFGKVYQAISQNTDRDPTLHTDIWEVAFVSYEDFKNYSDKIDKIEDEDGYLKHYVRKSQPEMDAPSKGVAYYNKTANTGLSFEGETPQIDINGTVVATFSNGKHNPKDVVTFEQLAIATQGYKVGDIYITTGAGAPYDRLGYGSWERFGEGRTLVGLTTSVSNQTPEWAKTVETEFGEYEHQLTIPEMPSHRHKLKHGRNNGSTDDDAGTIATDTDKWSNQYIPDSTQEAVGGDLPHNNVQPSIVVHFWRRTA